jgi:hypothetical protein
LASFTILENFKKKYSIEKTNVIVISDGEATDYFYYMKDDNIRVLSDTSILHLRHKKSNIEFEIVPKTKNNGYFTSTDVTQNLFEMVKTVHDLQLLGFYIINLGSGPIYSSLLHSILRTNLCDFNVNVIEDLCVSFNTNQYLAIKNNPYTLYYLISGGRNLYVSDSAEQVTLDNMEKNLNQKVILNKFIDAIA